MAQQNRDVGPRMNTLKITMTSRFREFVKMNHPTFFVSKVGVDPQAFFDKVYKIVHAMCVSFREKEELTSY